MPQSGHELPDAKEEAGDSIRDRLTEIEDALSTFPDRSPWEKRARDVRTALEAEDPLQALQKMRASEPGEALSPSGWVIKAMFDSETHVPTAPQFERGDLVLLPSGIIDTISRVWLEGKGPGRGLERTTSATTYQTTGLSQGGSPGLPTVEGRLRPAGEVLPWPSWRTDLTGMLRKGLRRLKSEGDTIVITKKVAGVLKERTRYATTVRHCGPAHHGLTGIDKWRVALQ